VTVPAPGSLLAVLADVLDPRGCKGRRHPSAAMLAATISAILTGARGCEAIAQWVRAQETKVWHWLGFCRKPPCANTFRDLLKRVPPEVLEEKLRAWIAGVLPPRQTDDPQPVALDGENLAALRNAALSLLRSKGGQRDSIRPSARQHATARFDETPGHLKKLSSAAG
jgi:hypothetical protein